jgi:peptide-methionine (S)-S-oxide reductase
MKTLRDALSQRGRQWVRQSGGGMQRSWAIARSAGIGLGLALGAGAAFAQDVPPPKLDLPLVSSPAQSSVVLAGGCFWGVQAVFQHVRGVTTAVSGYSGGASYSAHYSIVSLGVTRHAESVQVTWDPSQISFGHLLRVFFSVAHDPTQRNRQGPDHGAQYRSAIFHVDEDQRRIAAAYVAQLDANHVFGQPIATEIQPLTAFYVAESYHQDYAARHPDAPYIRVNDAPKVARLRAAFPDLYVSRD